MNSTLANKVLCIGLKCRCLGDQHHRRGGHRRSNGKPPRRRRFPPRHERDPPQRGDGPDQIPGRPRAEVVPLRNAARHQRRPPHRAVVRLDAIRAKIEEFKVELSVLIAKLLSPLDNPEPNGPQTHYEAAIEKDRPLPRRRLRPLALPVAGNAASALRDRPHHVRPPQRGLRAGIGMGSTRWPAPAWSRNTPRC